MNKELLKTADGQNLTEKDLRLRVLETVKTNL